MKEKTGLGWTLLGLAAALLVLSAIGAIALGNADPARTIGQVGLAQAAIYALAAWLVVTRPASVLASNRRALISILLIGLAMRLVILPSPPESSDIYRYIWDGRVQAAGINPYRYLPVDQALQALRDQSIYPSIYRAEYAPTIYPPMAQIVYVLATRISETVTFMKLVMVAFEGLAVWAILRLLAARSLPASRVILYAWHPLPLWEFAGSGHVDAVAIAFLLLAFLAADRRSPVLAGMALAAGGLVKYIPVVTGPAVYKRWDWRLPLAFLATVAVLYLPYLGVGTSVFGFLGGYIAEEGLGRGSGVFLWQLVSTVFRLPDHAAVYYFPAAAVLLAALGLGTVLRRRQNGADLAAAMLLAVAATVLISPHYQWYFAWLVPFLCFCPVAAVTYLTCAALYLYIGHWPPTLGDGLVIYGGAALVFIGECLIRRYQKREKDHGDAVPA